jgi:glucosamine-6-phosphate deaminase
MSADPTRFRIFENPDSASACVASEMARLIRERAALGRNAVLGLASGSTPLPLFEELIYLHQEEGLSFANVITFSLDEYLGLKGDDPNSFRFFLMRNLFDHLDIPDRNLHFLRGNLRPAAVNPHCAAYEKEISNAGGIDLQILGIGRNGHIAFNEPGSAKDSRTRRVVLAETTREDAAAGFGGIDQVPISALTLGCGTILEARRVILMAWGPKKARVVRRAIAGPATPKLPASYLQHHPSAQVFLDPPAAAVLVKESR